MEKELLDNLSSSTIRDVLSGIYTANDLVQKYELQTTFVDRLFHSLVPLLTHTHYKIRSRAFSLLNQILEEYDETISCPDIAIPSILLSILSVNKKIADASISCLRTIMNISETEAFWPDIEAVISDGRSTEIRIKILELLVDFAKRIPLPPIVKLLDDPKAQIRTFAREILDGADPADVRAAINITRISYEAMEKLISTSAFDLTDPTLAATDVRQITVSQSDAAALARKRAAKRRKAADERNAQNRRNVTTNNNNDGILLHGSPRSYAAISKRRKVFKEQNVQQSDIDQLNSENKNQSIVSKVKDSYAKASIPKEAPQEIALEYTESSSHNNNNSNSNNKRNRYESDSATLTSSQSNTNNSIRNNRSKPSQKVKKNQLKQNTKHEKPQKKGRGMSESSSSEAELLRSEDEANEEFLRLEKQAKQETNNNNANNTMNRPLGKIIPPPRVSLPVRPRDLSSATWLERASFLDMLKESLAMSTRFKESPSQIIECVLTTAVPPHKKVTFLIPPILSEIILHHPEVLRSHLSSIIQFALNTMVGKTWKNDTQFQQFLSVLILESDPTDLIDKALKIVDKNAHPLPYEVFILKAYESRDDIILPYNIVSHILSRLLKKATLEHDASELFTLICIKEKKSVQRFGSSQSPDVRKRIIPFLKSAQQNSDSSEKVVHRIVDLTGMTDPRDLKSIIEEEMAKSGSKCDIMRLSAALVNFPHEEKYVSKIFEDFVRFVAQLPQRVLAEYEDEFVRVCVTHFTDPRLLQRFLEADWVEPKAICGLSRCIWNCPSSILNGSEKYLPLLYTMFKESIGSTRYELVQIFLAIYQKTRVSVLSLPEVDKPYKKLIDDMMAQFRIVTPKM